MRGWGVLGWSLVVVIKRHFQDGEKTCRQLSKNTVGQQRHLCSWGYSHQSGTELLRTHGPSPSRCNDLLWLNVLFAGNWVESEDTENPFICHVMNLLWFLSDKGTRVRFCWTPSTCGTEGNERIDQLARETLDQMIDPLACATIQIGGH